MTGIQGVYNVGSSVEDIACNGKRYLILDWVSLASNTICFYLLGTDPTYTGILGVSIFYCHLRIACKDRLGALFESKN